MNVNAKKLPPLEGEVRFFQMPDGAFVIFSNKPGANSSCDDREVFKYFNICRNFLHGRDEFAESLVRDQQQHIAAFRSIPLPDGSEVMVKLPEGKKPTNDDAIELLDFAQHLLKMQVARVEARKPKSPAKTKTDAHKAFDVETHAKQQRNGVPAKG